MRIKRFLCGLAAALSLVAHGAEAQVVCASTVNGVSTTTGTVSIPLFYDTSIVLATPTTGQTVVIAQTTGTELLAPATLLASATLQLPACSPTYNGQFARFGSTQVVTTLTMTSAGGSILNALTTINSGGFAIYTCYGSGSTWYRVG